MSETSSSAKTDRQQARADAATRQRSRRLSLLGAMGVALLGGYRVYTTELEDPVLMSMGVGMIVLSALPAILWARRSERQLPAFEVMMLTGIPFYAFPLFDQNPSVAFFSNDVMLRAATAVLTFQVATLAVYFLLPGHAGRSSLWRQSLLPDSYLRHSRVGLAITTVYQFTAQYTDLIPYELGSVFRAVFYGIGMLCAFILMQRWGTDLLSPGEKVFVALNIAAQIIMHVATLYLIVGASLLLLVVISYTSASRRLPIATLIIGVGVFAFLHVGKDAMRKIYWQPGAPSVGLANLPNFFSEWITFSLVARAESDEGMASKLLERTSLFHVLCIAADSIPSRQPHLDGETYVNIPAQFVPRLFWSDKPGPHKSNSRLAVYLGFVVDEDAAQKVSIAFGTPCEAYVNFGFVGLVLLGGGYGLLFKRFATLTAASPPLSVGGVIMVLLMAWSLQAEMTLSVWISSLYQAAVVLIGVPVGIKVLFGR
ncbi:MAG: hypothetical protein Q7S40_11295 [Opitutaceae bacterium]|nr:hypothetical protein [Opitutaceae bacterium]